MKTKLILILLLTFSILFIGACGTSQGYNPPPAPSGGGCGVIVNSIPTVCSVSDVSSVNTG